MRTRWFRYALETPDDGAGGGGEPAADEPHVSVFERPELWDTPPAAEPEPPAGETPPAEPPPADAPAEKPDGWSDDDWGAFQKQFPKGTPADLWKHYSSLRTAYSRGERGAEPPAATPAAEPEPAAPTGWTSPDYSVLGEIPSDGLSVAQQHALAALMVEDPKSAAMWAVANSHLLSDDEFSAVQSHWHSADYWNASRYWEAARMQANQDRQEEELGPRLQAIDVQRQREGAALAEAAVPEITAHLEPFKEWLVARPAIDEHLGTLTDPEQVKNAVVAAFYQFYGPYRMSLDATEAAAAAERERVAAEEAAEAEAAAKNANRRAVTAGRGAPATPAGAGATPDDIRAAIRGARGG
jgi:hypothetical protein